MSALSPGTRFRAIALLLLFVAALVGGSVDAVACSSVVENSGTVISHDGDKGDHETKGQSDEGGICMHGHCHPGWQLASGVGEFAARGLPRAVYAFRDASTRASLISDPPEDPPRF